MQLRYYIGLIFFYYIRVQQGVPLIFCYLNFDNLNSVIRATVSVNIKENYFDQKFNVNRFLMMTHFLSDLYCCQHTQSNILD